MAFIPYGRQSIDDADVEAVEKVLRSDFLTTGPTVGRFEKAMAEYCGASYAVAVCNGTAALHLASLCLLEPGQKVLTTPNSFLATANAILYAGAKPVFVDIQPNGNIDLQACEERLQADSDIKALYAVHFSGNPVEQEKLASLKERFGLVILEDCAHSLGARYGNIEAGSCRHSDASIFSFHPVKNMTTGEGGMVTTNDEALYERLLTLRNHGIVRTPGMKPWEYEMRELGFNYRITDIQCALGLSQLAKLENFLKKRRRLAKQYDEAFRGHPLITPLYPYHDGSAYHLYVVRIDFGRAALDKAALFDAMHEKGIGLQVHYIPINKQPYYRRLGYGDESTPVMDEYYETCVSLPLFPDLGDTMQRKVIQTLTELLGG